MLLSVSSCRNFKYILKYSMWSLRWVMHWVWLNPHLRLFPTTPTSFGPHSPTLHDETRISWDFVTLSVGSFVVTQCCQPYVVTCNTRVGRYRCGACGRVNYCCEYETTSNNSHTLNQKVEHRWHQNWPSVSITRHINLRFVLADYSLISN